MIRVGFRESRPSYPIVVVRDDAGDHPGEFVADMALGQRRRAQIYQHFSSISRFKVRPECRPIDNELQSLQWRRVLDLDRLYLGHDFLNLPPVVVVMSETPGK